MSLATRCSACGTVFRVVQDQLRVSGGWVRCGRCAEVFNAIEGLVDLEIDRPTTDDDVGQHGSRVLEDLARLKAPAAAPADVEPDPLPLPERPPAIDEDLPESVDVPEETGRPVDIEETDAAVDARSPAHEADDEPAPAPAEPRPRVDLRGEPVAAVEPEFVRQAARAARWRHPGVRLGLSMIGLVLAGLMAAQILLAWHDLAAARWPRLGPIVERLCAWQGCVVEPPRQIDALIVDSSGLVRAGSDDLYRLAVVMRNRDDATALRLPSIELTLTDAGGQVLSRRVLDPGSLGAVGNRIAAGAELPLSALLRIAGGSPAGYTIELFYP